MRQQRRWTEAEEALLRTFDGKYREEAAQALGRDGRSVDQKGRRMGIQFKHGNAGLVTKRERRELAKREPWRATVLRFVPRVEWCYCGAPVSNWTEHYERMGHRRAM